MLRHLAVPPSLATSIRIKLRISEDEQVSRACTTAVSLLGLGKDRPGDCCPSAVQEEYSESLLEQCLRKVTTLERLVRARDEGTGKTVSSRKAVPAACVRQRRGG